MSVKPQTAAIHIPHRRRDGAMAPPIHLATTYEHSPSNELLFEHDYIRGGNPNVNDLELRLAALETGAKRVDALTFASGMAAGAALLETIEPGSTVIFHHELYFAFKRLADVALPARNISAKFINLKDEAAFEAAIDKNTALIWFETPSNPQLELLNIDLIVARAKSIGAKTVIDGTFATPALQHPFEFDVDYIIHSMTKFMGGHSDVQGGALVIRDDEEMHLRIKDLRGLHGYVLAPFNAWLIARGLQSLHCRMRAHSEHAFDVAMALEGHKNVARVNYPFLESNSDFAIAKKQMSAGGGILSFLVKGDRATTLDVASKVKLFVNATSVGGVESLIEHRKSVEGDWTSTPDTLLRLSVGLEHPKDLIDDLFTALDF